ncbi:NO-inducible flavohemoprotein [Undibacterium sp. TS12]|uniref:NO-inducible flavohemoprotein n=1 Tax=Undibacterium sp. TS12 TaxID=2908202 RepID=UPI001F4CD391|nr:NO-inducible flavohemoprotein [Undibacterium sp. TS12]MCH8619005.1 NO-inducible flavohemoprotein [Undibacterium sp. TS12]
MLDQSIRDLVKATVPVLKEHGVTLTRHFYARMFAHNPELKPVFNQGNQQSGGQQQALAMAVLAYAEHIDDPMVLLPVLTLVANKHVSVGIRAEHYPIVGGHLLASIKEVLGEAASDELIAAWAAAYGQLADVLTGLENDIYGKAALAEGGWTGWRAFKVSEKVMESEEITSFYLRPADGGKVPAYRPGQYITVKVFVPELGMMQPRQYSLSAAPGNAYLRISVKREAQMAEKPAGMVSNVLHRDISEGAILEVAPPMGDYFLHEDRDTPVVLISAGVGLTPKLSMLEHLTAQKSARQIRFLHACRHGGVHAFKHRVRELAQVHPQVKSMVYYETPRANDKVNVDYDYTGRLDLGKIADEVILPQADYYVCGPRAFMQAQVASLKSLGVDASRIHKEAFGSGGFAD